MRGVSQTRRRLGRLDVVIDGQLKEPMSVPHHALAEQRAPHLEHQLVVVLEGIPNHAQPIGRAQLLGLVPLVGG